MDQHQVQQMQPDLTQQQLNNHLLQTQRNGVNKKKLTAKWLGRSQVGISLLLFCVGVAQVCMASVPCYRQVASYRYGHYQLVWKWQRCRNHTIGENVWSSVFPFIAGIFGILASSKTAKRKQVALMMGFSIVGAVSMFVCMFINIIMTSRPYQSEPLMAPRVLTIMAAFMAGINMILLIVSSAFSCCLFNCCKTQTPQVVYIAYANSNNHGTQPVVIPTSIQGARPQVIMLSPANVNGQPQLVAQQQQQQQQPPQHEVENQQQLELQKSSPPKYEQFEDQE